MPSDNHAVLLLQHLQECLATITEAGFGDLSCSISRIRQASAARGQEEQFEALVTFGLRKRFVFSRSELQAAAGSLPAALT